MSTQDNKQLDELQALVTQLGDAAASNERRTARLEHTIRWGLLGGLTALGIALAITVKPLNDALADPGLTPGDVTRLVTALNGIKGSLDNLNVVGRMQRATVEQAKREAEKIVKEAPAVTRDVLPMATGPAMQVSCGRISRAEDIAIQRLNARYPLGASVLAYFCQQHPNHPALGRLGIDKDALDDFEAAMRSPNPDEPTIYEQAVMAGTVRTMTNAAGLVNNLHKVTTAFGGMTHSFWAKLLEQTKKEVEAIVLDNKLPDYCPIWKLRHSSQPLNATKAAKLREVKNLRIKYPLGSYALGYLCRKSPGTTNLNKKTIDKLWAEHRDEYQTILVQASVDTVVHMGTLVFRLREDSDMLRNWVAGGGADRALDRIAGQLHFLNASLAAMVRDMSVMRTTAGRMGSMMPW